MEVRCTVQCVCEKPPHRWMIDDFQDTVCIPAFISRCRPSQSVDHCGSAVYRQMVIPDQRGSKVEKLLLVMRKRGVLDIGIC